MATSLQAIFSEFRRQFRECLPRTWRERLGSQTAPYELKIGDDGESLRLVRDGHLLHETTLDVLSLDTSLAALLKSRRHPLILEIPSAWVLGRQLVLPAAARENLEQVIGFELDRITPFQADQVYFGYDPETASSPENSVLNIRVVLVPRVRVKPWLDALRHAGLQPDRMIPDGYRGGLNLLPAELRPGPDFRRMFIRVLPWVVLLGLFIAVLALPLWQAREVVSGLQQEEKRLRREAGVVLELKEQLAHKLEVLEKIRDRWQSVPPPLEVLQVLTHLLPDDTYLQQLEIRDTELTMRGLSGQASALIGLLEESPAFLDPHFLSPVTQQRGRELFHLGATIKVPFPYEALSTAPEKAGQEEKK